MICVIALAERPRLQKDKGKLRRNKVGHLVRVPDCARARTHQLCKGSTPAGCPAVRSDTPRASDKISVPIHHTNCELMSSESNHFEKKKKVAEQVHPARGLDAQSSRGRPLNSGAPRARCPGGSSRPGPCGR